VIKVMAEIGIDISNSRSKSIDVFQGEEFYYVVTLCDHAKKPAPFFLIAKNIFIKILLIQLELREGKISY